MQVGGVVVAPVAQPVALGQIGGGGGRPDGVVLRVQHRGLLGALHGPLRLVFAHQQVNDLDVEPRVGGVALDGFIIEADGFVVGAVVAAQLGQNGELGGRARRFIRRRRHNGIAYLFGVLNDVEADGNTEDDK